MTGALIYDFPAEIICNLRHGKRRLSLSPPLGRNISRGRSGKAAPILCRLPRKDAQMDFRSCWIPRINPPPTPPPAGDIFAGPPLHIHAPAVSGEVPSTLHPSFKHSFMNVNKDDRFPLPCLNPLSTWSLSLAFPVSVPVNVDLRPLSVLFVHPESCPCLTSPPPSARLGDLTAHSPLLSTGGSHTTGVVVAV